MGTKQGISKTFVREAVSTSADTASVCKRFIPAAAGERSFCDAQDAAQKKSAIQTIADFLIHQMLKEPASIKAERFSIPHGLFRRGIFL